MYSGCRDRVVVGFITTYAIGAYHHLCYEFESRSSEVYLIQHYMRKFVSDPRNKPKPRKLVFNEKINEFTE